MGRLRVWGLLTWGLGFLATTVGLAEEPPPPFAEYFRVETEKLASRPLAGIDSAEAWKAKRPELQRQLREMLGLEPLPECADLQARVTGTHEQPDFVVENVVFQSSPGLYVTGNLYRPKSVPKPIPAILYVCGHFKVEKDGVIYGNKTHYQHHAAWYAANGYVCLILDTLQLGELPGLHHGTNREAMWWWLSRGYTPAGIEAWNGIRGIDYLISRPEVDATKIGVTGRSGGGATSWWVGALDDRVAAVIPVAGITDLRNHVVDGAVEGHCDCMYINNTYRWDYNLLAALVAPKPMLVENTDKDPIFPEDGVRRIYASLEKVYGWYGASDKLGLVIGKGGHVDSEEIRHPSFAFMNKWLKNTDAKVLEIPRPVPMESLKVLAPNEVPAGVRNATIHEAFLPLAATPDVPKTLSALTQRRDLWLHDVKRLVFAGWPADSEVVPLDAKARPETKEGGDLLRGFDYTSQPGVRLTLWILMREETKSPKSWHVHVSTDNRWSGAATAPALREAFGRPGEGEALVIVTPRGLGLEGQGEKRDTHVRRRFGLLGQTLAGMQAYDVRRGLEVLRTQGDLGADPAITLEGRGQAASLALWAAVFEPEVDTVKLVDPPATVRDGPAFLNLERVVGMPQAVSLVAPRKVQLTVRDPSAWRWDLDLKEALGKEADWLEIRDRP